MYAALIFDCDGVLVDSEVLAVEVELAALAELGLIYESGEFIRRFMGIPDSAFFAALCATAYRDEASRSHPIFRNCTRTGSAPRCGNNSLRSPGQFRPWANARSKRRSPAPARPPCFALNWRRSDCGRCSLRMSTLATWWNGESRLRIFSYLKDPLGASHSQFNAAGLGAVSAANEPPDGHACRSTGKNAIDTILDHHTVRRLCSQLAIGWPSKGDDMRRIAALMLGLAISLLRLEASANGCEAPAIMADGWSVSPPSEQGLDPALICSIGARLKDLSGASANGVVIARHGVLVYEQYFAGADQRWPEHSWGKSLRSCSTTPRPSTTSHRSRKAWSPCWWASPSIAAR